MMVSPFPAPQLQARKPHSPLPRRSSQSSALIPDGSHGGTSGKTSIGRKRARPESPSRDWHGSSSAYDSWVVGPSASPGFFNDETSFFSGGRQESSNSYSMTSTSFASPGLISPSFASPSPLMQSRYKLAGGQITPNLTHSAASDISLNGFGRFDGSTSDLGYRRGRPYHEEQNRSATTSSLPQSFEDRLPTALSRESNGRARALPGSDDLAYSGSNWSVLQSVTGMVGRMWDFCTAGTFRGFFAGGGTGYIINASESGELREAAPAPAEKLRLELSSSAHLPGGFPDEDYISNYLDLPSSPTAKKAKRARHGDEAAVHRVNNLTQSWVMVRDHSTASTPTQTATSCAPTSASPASMRQTPTRPSLRRSSGANAVGSVRPSLHGRSASAAGLRSPTRTPLHTRHNSQVVSTKGRSKRDSAAFLGEEDSQPDKKAESPLAAETARFVKDMRKKERREDRDIYRMNRALEDLIREGQEALGTTVEVDLMQDDSEEEMW